MKQILVLMGAIFLAACNPTSSSEELTAYDKLQGTWTVTTASIDGESQQVTAIGLGQMRAIFEDYNFYYVYPVVNDIGMPTSETDTVAGIWSLSDDEITLTISDHSGLYTLMEWNITKLLVGTLSAQYTAQSASGAGTALYAMTYNLQ